MSAHTPGPWGFYPSKDGFHMVVPGEGSPVFDRNIAIAKEVRSVDVRLVAAAPKLLEALQHAFLYVREYPGPTRDAVIAAIVEATGVAP